MNFLAHLYLSGTNEDIIIGNFIADMVKGRQIEKFHEGIVNGILLHRKIDLFTDTHPIVEKSKMRLKNKYRLYSGVIVDMFYDHYLSRNWSAWSAQPLREHVATAYNLLLKNYFILPPRARQVLPFMVTANWLVGYGRLESLQRHLNGMARRTPFDSGMEKAVGDLKVHYEEFGLEFEAFFPELIIFVEKQGICLDIHHSYTKPEKE